LQIPKDRLRSFDAFIAQIAESGSSPGKVFVEMFESTGFAGILPSTDITMGNWVRLFSACQSMDSGRIRDELSGAMPRKTNASAAAERQPIITEPVA
jgi:hypothetical protein